MAIIDSNQGDGIATPKPGLMRRLGVWLGRFLFRWTKRLAIFLIGLQCVFWLLNLYDRTLGAPQFSGPPIPYKQLATEESHPYKFDRKLPSFAKRQLDSRSNSPWNGQLKRGVKKFPDVRSCLHYSERDKEVPDLRKMDFTLISNAMEFDVCLTRIFTSIGGMEGARRWVKARRLSQTGVGPIEKCVIGDKIKTCRDFIIVWTRKVGSSFRTYKEPLKIPLAWGWRKFWGYISYDKVFMYSRPMTIVVSVGDGEYFMVDTISLSSN